jgi:hypothetical protein
MFKIAHRAMWWQGGMLVVAVCSHSVARQPLAALRGHRWPPSGARALAGPLDASAHPPRGFGSMRPTMDSMTSGRVSPQ